jgi:glutaminase
MNFVENIVGDLYQEFREKYIQGGLGIYIPDLSKVNANSFGIVVTYVDVFQYAYGDVDVGFTIQSVSKPFVYGMAIQEFGIEKVLEKISVEPTGESFNSISLYPETGIPFNPMINAGAITATSLLWDKYGSGTYMHILRTLSAYAGSALSLDQAVYRSESETGHRNRAIAYLLRNFNILQSDVNGPLDVYFRQCSINVNCRQLSVMGATLAANGYNPTTGKKVVRAKFIPYLLSVMATCGMYDYSGEWIYNVGLPAKSGVGGGLVAVLPGQLAIAAYSPLLDGKGNSVMGVELCKRIAQSFSLHLYKTPRQIRQVVRRQLTLNERRSKFKRDDRAERLLETYGGDTHIMELQGELYFSTCELFMRKVPGDAKTLVLSLQKCVTLDEGAVRLLLQLNEAYAASNKSLYVTDYQDLDPLMAIRAKYPSLFRFDTLDDALIAMESCLLKSHGYEQSSEPIALVNQQLLKGLTEVELCQLKKYLVHEQYAKGDYVIKKGSVAQKLFFLESGQVMIQDTVNKRDFTLAFISPGNSFGEMALLDKQRRSANVIALTDISCWIIRFRILDKMEHLVGIKMKILMNLGASLSSRLRSANKELASFT